MIVYRLFILFRAFHVLFKDVSPWRMITTHCDRTQNVNLRITQLDHNTGADTKQSRVKTQKWQRSHTTDNDSFCPVTVLVVTNAPLRHSRNNSRACACDLWSHMSATGIKTLWFCDITVHSHSLVNSVITKPLVLCPVALIVWTRITSTRTRVISYREYLILPKASLSHTLWAICYEFGVSKVI